MFQSLGNIDWATFTVPSSARPSVCFVEWFSKLETTSTIFALVCLSLHSYTSISISISISREREREREMRQDRKKKIALFPTTAA